MGPGFTEHYTAMIKGNAMPQASDIVLNAYNQYSSEMNGHKKWMDQDQIDFRIKWKNQHSRMKGANQAYKRHCERVKAKTLKFLDKWIKEDK